MNRIIDGLEHAVRCLYGLEPARDICAAALSCLHRTIHVALDGLHRLGNLLREFSRLLGKLTDFLSNDREAASMLARARRFNGGVQCEQVCLLRDARNDVDTAADLLGAASERRDRAFNGLRSRLDLMHVVDDFIDGAASFVDALDRIARHLSH